MRLVRTSFAYENVLEHLREGERSPLIEIYLVQFLLVAFYSELEEKVKQIIADRIELIDDHKVAGFIFKNQESIFKRVKKSDINTVLQNFKCGDGDVLQAHLGEMNLQPYHDAITNRHLVSHDDGASMTIGEFANVLPCAEAILEVLSRELGRK